MDKPLVVNKGFKYLTTAHLLLALPEASYVLTTYLLLALSEASYLQALFSPQQYYYTRSSRLCQPLLKKIFLQIPRPLSNCDYQKEQRDYKSPFRVFSFGLTLARIFTITATYHLVQRN
jgi:hypothetical protein